MKRTSSSLANMAGLLMGARQLRAEIAGEARRGEDRRALERAQDGRWLIAFHRARRPRQDYGTPTHPAAALAPAVLLLVDDIVNFTASPQSRPWFGHCVNTLGPESARFYFAQLNEACSVQQVENRARS